MRGFLARVQAARNPQENSLSATAVPGLDALLQRIAACAAIPREDLDQAASLACQSESALAILLRHIEENIAAPASEWRRIHGAVALLERLLRAKGCEGEALVGQAWYEAKMQDKLSNLAHFECSEDTRVSQLMKRAVANVQSAAEKYLDDDDAVDDAEKPSAEDQTDSAIPRRRGTSEDIKTPAVPSPVQLGRSCSGESEVRATRAKMWTKTALELESLCSPGTLKGQDTVKQVSGASSPQNDASNGQQQSSWMCCCRRRRHDADTRTPVGSEASTADLEAQSLIT
eukprot:TRINITY_DN64564_c0_g1_i1.p1 TRINITY_DN64564_c0_g1~~TRINITY_DN64564_c0_g1_i1.p1  ORF type:complete len:287 (+),score=51.73 TRINITY_DN64564_c0_g1_i1:73-933(+)